MRKPLLLLLFSFLCLQSLRAQVQDSSYRFYMKFAGHGSDLESVAFSFDGKMFASGGWDNRILVYGADTPNFGQKLFTLEGHYAGISCVAFSRDGKMLASASRDFSVKIWDLSNGSLITTLSQHTDVVNRVYFDQAGKNVLTCSNDGTIQILDIARIAKPKVLKIGGQVNGFVQSPDRKSFYVATNGAEILQVDPTGKVIRKLSGHSDAVNQIELTPDRKFLVSCSNDKTAIIWDIANAKPLRKCNGHNWKVTGFSISSDSRYLLTGCNDGEAIVWDMATAKALATLKGMGTNVRSVAFAPNLTRVLLASYMQVSDYGALMYSTPLIRAPKPGTPAKPAAGPAKPAAPAKPGVTPAKPSAAANPVKRP
jgi:WD40 repeat protein